MQTCRAVAGVVGLALAVTGCGGGSNGTPGGGNGATVTVTFTGLTPVAVATQVGAGGFTSATPGNQLTLTIPSGVTKYAVAFLCPAGTGSPISNSEMVVETTTQENASLSENCFASPTTGIATGNASSAITGTTVLDVIGKNGGAAFSSNSASFSVPVAVGPNDVAVVARDVSQNIVGIKIVRSQTVPGVVGGSGIALLVAD